MMKSIFVLMLVSLVLNSLAGDKADKTPWKTIFNGKDFTNWKIVGSKGFVVIKDSAFYCHMTANTPEHTFVTTKEKFLSKSFCHSMRVTQSFF